MRERCWFGHDTDESFLSLSPCRWLLKACRGVRRCNQHDKLFQLWRGEPLRPASPGAELALYRVPQGKERKPMSVFVLDQHKQPLMPCSEKRARLLLSRHRAVVHRIMPFTIRLKDRKVEECHLQPMALKLDPGSRTTGIALVRVELSLQGEVHHAVHLAELAHRGEDVHKAMQQRRGFRRRR